MPRIALIHATPIAIEPIRQAFASGWPEAEVVNLLDDSLSVDRARSIEVSDQLIERMIALTRYAELMGSAAVLFTCSAFSRAIDLSASATTLPVLRPNEAMFESAIRRGGRIAMVYTFPPSREGMEQEFREQAVRLDPNATMTSFFAPGAIEAARSGDMETHNRLVAKEAAQLKEFDAITLAHFSTARAREAVEAVTDIPVLTSPDSAVSKLKNLLG